MQPSEAAEPPGKRGGWRGGDRGFEPPSSSQRI
jgi:hypothetical protein